MAAAALTAALVAAAAPLAARAQSDEPALVAGGLGWFDVLDDEDTVDLRLEYRHGGRLWIFEPWAGVEATGDGGLWGGGGVLIDVHLARRIVLTGSFGAGLFEEGDGKDLGSAIEFRSQVELGYRFDDRSRLSLAFSHMSNADIEERNPGAETVTLYYALPVGRIFGE